MAFQRTFIGIDIRRRGITAVQVTTGFRRLAITDWAEVPRSEAPDRAASLAEALEALARRLPLATATCLVGLPARWMSFRSLPVPFKETRKIQQVLPFEMEARVPYAVGQYRFAFRRLDKALYPGNTAVLAAGVPREPLEDVLTALRDRRADPGHLTIGGLAETCWLAAHEDTAQPLLLLNLDAAGAGLFFAAGGEPILIRHLPLDDPPLEAPAALAAAVRFTEAAFCGRHGIDLRADTVWVTGAAAQDADLAPLAEALARSVRPLDMAAQAGLSLPPDPETPWVPGRGNTALALVLAESEGLAPIRFHRRRFPAAGNFARYRKEWIRTAVAAAVLLGVLISGSVVSAFQKQAEVDTLQTAITQLFREAFPEAERIVDPASQMRSGVTALKRDALQGLSITPGQLRVDILLEISRRIDPGLQLEITRLVIGDATVSMAGTAEDFNTINAVQSRLENIPFLKEVVIDFANIEANSRQVRFQITGRLV